MSPVEFAQVSNAQAIPESRVSDPADSLLRLFSGDMLAH